MCFLVAIVVKAVLIFFIFIALFGGILRHSLVLGHLLPVYIMLLLLLLFFSHCWQGIVGICFTFSLLIILAAAILVWLTYITIFLLRLPVLILIFLNHSDEFIEHVGLSRLVEEVVDSDELSHICAVLDGLLVVLLELVDVVEA